LALEPCVDNVCHRTDAKRLAAFMAIAVAGPCVIHSQAFYFPLCASKIWVDSSMAWGNRGPPKKSQRYRPFHPNRHAPQFRVDLTFGAAARALADGGCELIETPLMTIVVIRFSAAMRSRISRVIKPS
jgi:hypothetical protein